MNAEKKEKGYFVTLLCIIALGIVFAVCGNQYMLSKFGRLFKNQDVATKDDQKGYVKTDDGWLYRINEDNEITIIGCESGKTTVEIPEQLDGYIVSVIGESAFMYSGIKEVEMGNNIVRIENFAFAGCEELSSVTLPKSVIEISEFSFMDCNKDVVFEVDKDSYAMTFVSENKMQYVVSE
jgi:hypothetical protein